VKNILLKNTFNIKIQSKIYILYIYKNIIAELRNIFIIFFKKKNTFNIVIILVNQKDFGT
jgi:hypothetical protein